MVCVTLHGYSVPVTLQGCFVCVTLQGYFMCITLQSCMGDSAITKEITSDEHVLVNPRKIE